MLVFIDECGDPGFKFDNNSSRFFAISLIIFENNEIVNATSQAIDAFRTQIGSHREFKFSKDNKQIKTTFFQIISKFDFKIETILVDKEKIQSHFLRSKPKSFYNFILKQILSHSQIDNAKIVLDGSGSKHFTNELKSYLKKDTKNKIKKLELKDSKKDNLLQVADMVVGGISYYYKNGDDYYKTMLTKSKLNVWEFK